MASNPPISSLSQRRSMRTTRTIITMRTTVPIPIYTRDSFLRAPLAGAGGSDTAARLGPG